MAASEFRVLFKSGLVRFSNSSSIGSGANYPATCFGWVCRGDCPLLLKGAQQATEFVITVPLAISEYDLLFLGYDPLLLRPQTFVSPLGILSDLTRGVSRSGGKTGNHHSP